MRTHPFDAVSFVFGAIFVAVAVVALTDLLTVSLVDLRWFGPAVLVLVGIVLVISAARRDGPDPQLADAEEQEAQTD